MIQRTQPGMRRASGFTLLEVVIAAAVLAVVVGIALSVTITGQKVLTYGVTQADGDETSRRIIEQIADEIAGADGGTLQITNSHSSLQYRVPIDPDGDGDVLAADGRTVEYGALVGAIPMLNHSIRYRFVQEGVLDEALTRLDYNRDGLIGFTPQFTGKLAVGRIERAILDGGGVVVGNSTAIARFVVLRDAPLDGDLDSDGVADPLFIRISGYAAGIPTENVINGNQILVNLWIGRTTLDRQPTLSNGRTAVRLRNVP